jgi:hypothetical protein
MVTWLFGGYGQVTTLYGNTRTIMYDTQRYAAESFPRPAFRRKKKELQNNGERTQTLIFRPGTLFRRTPLPDSILK